jgi:E3 ubiquitin-protein ligase HUWE1
MIEGVPIDAHLTTAFLKHILNRPPSLRDLEEVDPEVHKSMKWLQEHKVTSELGLDFSATDGELGLEMKIDLIPNGSTVPVTEENKNQYVSRMIEYYLRERIKDQLDEFCKGFHALIPIDEIKYLQPSELDLIICGVPEINIQDLKENCQLHQPYEPNHPVIQRFFRVLEKWDNEKRAKLLKFWTGSSKVPQGGFKTFRDTNAPMSITQGGDKERLPVAHTCLLQLSLPVYDDDMDMDKKLGWFIYECETFEMG